MKRSFANLFNFFNLLNLTPTTEPITNAAPSLANAVIPEESDRMPAVLEHGNYSILDAKGHILVGHITLPDIKLLAPQIAKERHECVRILKHA